MPTWKEIASLAEKRAKKLAPRGVGVGILEAGKAAGLRELAKFCKAKDVIISPNIQETHDRGGGWCSDECPLCIIEDFERG